MRTSLLSASLTAGQIIFPICLAIVVPSTASASQCKDLDVPYSWEAKILGESLVEVTQKTPSVGGLQKERDGKIQIKFLHQPPSAICAPPPPMPTTGLRVTAQAEYYYICNAFLYCNDSPSHRSSFTIGNDSIDLLDSYRDPSFINSARYIKLADISNPSDPNPKNFSFDFAGAVGLEEQISYEILSEVSGISPFGVDELRTRSFINLSLTTNDAGSITYSVPEPVPSPLGILGVGAAAKYARSLRKRLKKKR